MSARFGYTLMTEQAGPKQLITDAVAAERAGFDFEVCSDHYSPWLAEQGHAPFAWSVLGAVAGRTERVELISFVTCPTMRYHPAVVAQQAATTQLLADGRFVLGLGSGENLNEHVIGQGWPGVPARQEMLVEALHIIRALLDGGLVDFVGEHFRVDAARLWDRPADGVPIGVAISGELGISSFAPLAEHLIAVEPNAELIKQWNGVDGAPKIGQQARAIGQLPVCWDPDADAAIARAHDQFRWFAGGWPVNADLRTPAGFAAATRLVTPEDVAAAIPCGPDLDAIAEAVQGYLDAGFTDVALIQIGGGTQERFLTEAAGPLLERLRRL